MSDDLSGSIDEMNKKFTVTDKIVSSILGKLQGFGSAVKAVPGNAGSSTQVANYSSSGPFGSGPGGGPGGGPFTPLQAPNDTRFAGNTGRTALTTIKQIMGAAVTGAMVTAAFLPTAQEAQTMEQISERMRFYSNNIGNTGKNPQSKSFNNPLYQYSIMNRAVSMGTAVNPGDILQAVNAGTSVGLTTGLKNYNAGSGFSGILGGAALASNLTPGIGLTGGMGVMAGINQAQSVNMLKMLGIQVRNNNGTSMNDLPQIIEQLYGLLTRNGPINPEDIATSLMPGNALDSLLTQYFGQDQNTRNTVISGLIQRVKSGNNLRTSGSKGALEHTGGTSRPVISSSNRNQAEQQLIQSYARVTNQGAMGANNVLQSIYGSLANASGTVRSGLDNIQKLSTGVTSFAGARGNAGGAALSAIMDLGGAVAGKKMFSLETGLSLAGVAALTGVTAESASKNGATGILNNAWSVGDLNQLSGNTAPGSAQSTVGPQFTGAVTINVSAPPGSDPYAFSSAFLDAMK